MNILKRLKHKIYSMNISTKLKFISSVTLFIPLCLSTICCAIIFLTFVTNEYAIILNLIEPTENTHYAYSACEYIYKTFKNQIINENNDDITSLFLDETQYEQGIVYLEVKKNGELIYNTTSSEKPENYDELYSIVDNQLEKVYTIVDDHIIFRIKIKHNGNDYILFAHGNVRTFYPYEKTAEFYIGFLMTNFLFIVIVTLAVMILSKVLNRAVFKRVEYSLSILSEGVKKLSEGNLDFRIKYDRDDEFKPICDNFNYMADELKHSVELIEKQDKNQRDMILGISHDLFSPLTSIKAYVEGLQDGIATTEEMRKKYLDTINTKAEQIEKTVSQMLLCSKIKENSIVVNKVNFELSEFIKAFIEANNPDYSIKNIRVTVKRCDKVIINGDKSMLNRVLTNIIDNSRKYSDKDVCQIDIELIKQMNKCCLIISDNGPGADKAEIDRLFEMFYTGDKARQNPGKSNGIGLSIVYNIINQVYNGTVKAENKDGGGLRTIIELPIIKENL